MRVKGPSGNKINSAVILYRLLGTFRTLMDNLFRKGVVIGICICIAIYVIFVYT